MAGDEQRARFEQSEEDRILAAGYQMGRAATLGVLGMDVAVSGGRGVGTQPYDPSWRSIAGQAGGEAAKLRGMSERHQLAGAPRVYSSVPGTPRFTYATPDPQNVSWAARDIAQQAATRDYPFYRGEYGTGSPEMRVQARRVANARAMAVQAAERVPVAAAGESALLAGGLALPLVAGPGQFLFGEGPGSYAETQQFEPQIASLARYKDAPLEMRDLNPETIQTIASDPGVLSRLYEAGYLSDAAAAEISRIRSADLEGVELERLRALGGVSE